MGKRSSFTSIWLKLGLLIVVLALSFKVSRIYAFRNQGKVCCGQACFLVDLAITAQERSKGLMFRRKMARDQGMLFIYKDEQIRFFWMKNTYLPLDLVWLDSDRKVIGVTPDVRPCLKDNCTRYSSPCPAQYVLEINAGMAEKKGVKPGLECVFVLE